MKEYNNYDFKDPEKIVMIGDQLTMDIFFGNFNDMATVWVYKF